MRNEFDDHQADDVRAQFWGQPFTDGRRGASSAPRDDTPVTGAIRAVKDSWAAFRPRSADNRTGATPASSTGDGTGALPRTRQHNTIDPSGATPRGGRSASPFSPPSRRKRVARHDLSIAELAAGETPLSDPAWDDLDDWSELDALTARHEALRASRQHRSEFAAPLDDRTPQAPRRPSVDRADFWADAPADDAVDQTTSHTIPLSSQLAEKVGWRGADPLLVRGVMAALVTLTLLPLLWLRGGGSDEPVASSQIEAPTVSTGLGAEVAAPTTLEVAAATTAVTVVEAATATTLAAAPAPAAESSNVQTTAAQAKSSSGNGGGSSSTKSDPTTKPAKKPAPDCSNTYKAVEGDSWWGIADRANVKIDSLLNQNQADDSTVILPGDKICLPSGADDPTVVTTSTKAPTTTDAPTSTTNAPTTDAPTTTSAPTTTNAPPSGSPGPNATPEEVKQVIRDVFPDELEEKALDIAYRESRYVPTADNGFCCHGIFQIYYSVHKGWLVNLGINSVEDLHDPLLNAKAALELYHRAGDSWDPWTTA